MTMFNTVAFEGRLRIWNTRSLCKTYVQTDLKKQQHDKWKNDQVRNNINLQLNLDPLNQQHHIQGGDDQ